MPKARDMIGNRYGRLTVAEFASRIERSGSMFKQWRCRCDCGNEVVAVTGALTSGNTKSCGCQKADRARAQMTTHGGRHTPEYSIWRDMLRRCEDTSRKTYKDYGARGIKVCPRWHSFADFLADMGLRPSRAHSIERRDNSKGYDPENCLWVERREQNRNQRRRLDNTSGVTGVVWNHYRRKWEAFIGDRGKRVYIGLFDDVPSAAAAREAKAAELGFNPNHGGTR